MNKLLVGSLVVAALAGSAEAKVLIRYSFANVTNENGQIVVTNTAPDYLGKYTATVRSYDKKWSNNAKITWGATVANMPVYSGDITNLCPHVDVQAGDAKQDHEKVGGALKWGQDGMLGGLVIDEGIVEITAAGAQGAGKIIVTDISDYRLNIAKEFGADIVLNPSTCDVVEEVMKLTEGYGCDIYIEAVGAPQSVTQGIQMLRKLGRFVEFGVFAQPTSFDWSVIGDGKELDVLGSHLSPYAYPFVVKHMMDGTLKTDGVLKTWFELKDWEKAFDYATGKYGDFKVAFKFD